MHFRRTHGPRRENLRACLHSRIQIRRTRRGCTGANPPKTLLRSLVAPGKTRNQCRCAALLQNPKHRTMGGRGYKPADIAACSARYRQAFSVIWYHGGCKTKAAERVTRRRQNPKKPNENNLPFVLPALARLQRRFSDAYGIKSHTSATTRAGFLKAINRQSDG